jgi:6-pyruvoyltetrahydropterin/6-carboxytetrahydropterin synthase
VFELTLTTSFSAAHALVIKGVREPVHGHDWQVEATVSGHDLDEDGMLCDFHALESILAEVIAPFQTADLNAAEPFEDVNPSAEEVARYIGRALAGSLPESVTLQRLSVTEAPGCKAAWIPEGKEGGSG